MPSINLGKVVGDKGVSLRNRGEWNNTAQYINNAQYIDMVSHNGNLWTCLTTNTNLEPTESTAEWNLSAKSVSNVYFEEAVQRENITSGENVGISFGKIAKWFSDLKTAAFKGVSNVLTQTADGYVLDARQGKVLEDKKLNKDSVVASTSITEPGFVMDGKTTADAIAELNNDLRERIKMVTVSLGSYALVAGGQTNAVNVSYTPPSGYAVIGYTLQLPVRFTAAIRYSNNAFSGSLFNPTNGGGTYEVGVMIILMRI